MMCAFMSFVEKIFPIKWWWAILFFTASCQKDLVKWQSIQKLESHTQNQLNRIEAVDDSTFVIAGGEKFSSAEIFISKDFGNTWQLYTVPEAGKGFYGLGVAPDKTIYLTGFGGEFVKGNTDSLRWQYAPIDPPLYYTDVAFAENYKGILISTILHEKGSISIIDSGGAIQNMQNLDVGLNDIELIDNQTAFVSGYGIIMKTSDGGNSWQTLDIANDNFTAIHAPGKNEVWTCGYNGSIFHTTDGGKSWVCMRDGNNFLKIRYRLLDIIFTDRLHGYAVGESGAFIYTDDGGNHWMEFERFTDEDLRCIISKKDGGLIVGGTHGALYCVYPKFFQ